MKTIKVLLLPFFCLGFLSASSAEISTAPYFAEISSETGLSGVSAQNVSWADINGDGYPDCVLTGNKNGSVLSVFLNVEKNGKRVFSDFTEESGINKDPAVSSGTRIASFIIFGDVNNDGYPDIFSGRYCEFEKPKTEPKTDAPLKDASGKIIFDKKDDGLRTLLMLNDGAGHFAAVLDTGNAFPPETATSGAFFDYDRDGNLDLFIGNWYKEYGVSYISYPSRLYRGIGNGKFSEVTAAAGLMTYPTEGKKDSSRPVYGVSHCDWNNDGFQDILVSVYGRQANRLWRNNGDGTFTDVGPNTGFDGDEIRHGRYPPGIRREAEPEWRSHGNTFSAACADYDNDGDMDIYLGEITHYWAGESSDLSSLLENMGPEKGFAFHRHPDIPYRVHLETRTWNQGDMRVSWADFDNDGMLDLVIASGDYPDGQYLRLFRQVRPLVFEEITDLAGFNWESSGGISIGDYDGDGRLDILAGKSWMRMPAAKRKGLWPAPALFHNNIANGNHWISIKLEGRGAGGDNRDGVGVRVRVKAGQLTQLREISTSHGHSGLSDEQILHFGLGKSEKVDSVEVFWKSGAAFYKDLPADKFLRLREGSSEAELSSGPFPG